MKIPTLLRSKQKPGAKSGKIVPIPAAAVVEKAEETPASEYESLTTMVPTRHYQLLEIVRRMSSCDIDQCGKKRLTSSKVFWGFFRDELPLEFGPNGQYVVQDVRLICPPIFESSTTSVYGIVGVPDKVVRYRVSFEKQQYDEGVLDYWFLKRLESANIAPKAYYYSAPMDPNNYDLYGDIIADSHEGKTKLFKSKNLAHAPEIRYVLMDRVGLSVSAYAYMRNQIPFCDVIRMGGQMISLMEKLHALDFIHGDAHMGNIAILNNKLVLIDFGRARIINHSELSDRHIHSSNYFDTCRWFSPWEMQKHMPSFRDDVYRVLHGMAECIHGDKFSAYLRYANKPDFFTGWRSDGYENIRNHFIEMKLSGQIFDIPKYDSVMVEVSLPEDQPKSFSLEDHVPPEALVEVRRLLGEVMTALLAVGVHDKPDYFGIKRRFAEVLAAVEGKPLDESMFSEAFFDTTFSVKFDVV